MWLPGCGAQAHVCHCLELSCDGECHCRSTLRQRGTWWPQEAWPITGDQVEEHGCRSCPILQKRDPQTLQRQVGLAYLGVLTQAVEGVGAVLTGTYGGWEVVRGASAHFWQQAAVLGHMDLATCLLECPQHVTSASCAARGSEGTARKRLQWLLGPSLRSHSLSAFVRNKSPLPTYTPGTGRCSSFRGDQCKTPCAHTVELAQSKLGLDCLSQSH